MKPGNNQRLEAYKRQEQTLGELSEDLRLKIAEMIQFYDPINRIRGTGSANTTGRDPRLPMPGSFIVKNYKGKRLEVKVLENSFEYERLTYDNLSAVAKAITGAHWNGFIFFGIKGNGRRK